MSVALTDGPLGVEATHALGPVTLNQPGSYPWVRVKRITGLHDMANTDNPSDPLVGRSGVVLRRSQLREKNVTYSGTIEALTLPSLRATASALRTAASNLADQSITIAPHPTWGSISLVIFGRPIAYTSDDEQTRSAQSLPSAYQRDFVLTFFMTDPRAYYVDGPVTAGAAAATADTITPGGTAPTEPTFSIAGATTGAIVLHNLTQGKQLAFLSGLTLGGGDTLTVDFSKRTALKGSDDVTGFINWSSSDWWDEDAYGIAPTAESLRVDGAGAWTATAFPATY